MLLVKRLMISRALNLGADKWSGVTYSIHRVSLNAAAAQEIGEYLWEKLSQHSISYLLAPGSGAAPIAAAIGAAALKDNVVLETLHVRDPKRAREGERLVEGYIPNTKVKAAFIDDVITRGRTYKQTLETLAQYTDKIECVAVGLAFDSFHPRGSRALVASGIPVYAVSERRDLGLTRDSTRKVRKVFSPAIWIRAGLISKPQFQRKTTPIVTENEVICGLDDCTVSAFSVEDGQQLWQINSPLKRSKGSSCELLLANDGVLYSGNYAGFLTASKNGEILWQFKISHAIHSRPTLYQNHLFQNVEDFVDGQPKGRLLCINASDGKLIWEIPHSHFGPTGVSISNEVIVTSHNNHELIAASIDGRKLWTHKLGALTRGRALVFSNEVIYLDEKGFLNKLDLISGNLIKRIRFSTSSAHSEPLLVDGVLVVTDNSMHMAGYDPHTLERIWINRLRGACQWKPTVYKHYLLTRTTEGGLAVTIAKTGEKVWEEKHRWRWGTGPIGVSSNHAAILSLDGRLTFHKLEI